MLADLVFWEDSVRTSSSFSTYSHFLNFMYIFPLLFLYVSGFHLPSLSLKIHGFTENSRDFRTNNDLWVTSLLCEPMGYDFVVRL